MRQTQVFVGVGSNVEPARELRAGIEALRAAFGELQISSVYRSPAWGFVGDDFLNVVVAFDTTLDADAVEAHLDAIENAGNRPRAGGRFAPRALDCDLLLFGAQVDAARRLPRDDVLNYPFVLGPLAEIAPQACHPLDGCSYATHWRARAAGTALERVCAFEELDLPADAAAAVDGENLSGHVGSVAHEI